MELEIDAKKDDVEKVLRAALTPDEFATLVVRSVPASGDPLSSQPRRLDPLTWVGFAMAGGVIGNGTYELMKKAGSALIERFGRKRVSEKDSKN